jgi:quinol monooxygenase YgiN
MSDPSGASNVTVHVVWEALEKDLPRLTEIIMEMRGQVKSEPGCLRFEAFRVQGAARFVLLETYADEAAAELHRTTPHYQRLIKGGAIPLLTRREVQRLDPITPAV